MGSDRMGTHNSVKITIVCLLLLFVCAAPVGEHKFKKKVEIIYTTQQFELAYDDSKQADFTVDSGGNLIIEPTADAILKTGDSIYLKATGDTDDYFEVRTIDDMPVIRRIGGREFRLENDDTSLLIFQLYEDAENFLSITLDENNDRVLITSKKGEIYLQANGDVNDYIVLSTTDDVPQISTLGDCDLKIAAASGEIQLDDNTTVNGTFDAGAGTFTSGIFNGDVRSRWFGNVRKYLWPTLYFYRPDTFRQ